MAEEKKNVKEEKQRLTDEELDNVIGGRRPPLDENGNKWEYQTKPSE